MAIKRLTIELDDSPDKASPTNVPDGARASGSREFKAREMTGVPSEKEEDETSAPNVSRVGPRAPGRTTADLFAEFANDARAMATLLMLAAFIVFAAKIQTLADLIYPVIAGGMLNAIWFGVSWIRRRGNSKRSE